MDLHHSAAAVELEITSLESKSPTHKNVVELRRKRFQLTHDIT